MEHKAAPPKKFLRSPGRYVTADGRADEAPLVFWGEWEPPSYVTMKWSAKGDLPQFLQEPRWERPIGSPGAWRQNTDPWVFGGRFRYSNCHQLNQNALRHLPAGSVIVFGSTLELNVRPRFVLDTVFVVAEQRQKFTPANPPDTDEVFRVCTLDPLSVGDDRNASFTLYNAASYEAPVCGMYSFVP